MQTENAIHNQGTKAQTGSSANGGPVIIGLRKAFGKRISQALENCCSPPSKNAIRSKAFTVTCKIGATLHSLLGFSASLPRNNLINTPAEAAEEEEEEAEKNFAEC